MAKKTRLHKEGTPPDHTSVLTLVTVPNDQLRRTLRVLSALDAKLIGTFGVVPIAMRTLLESEGFNAPSPESTALLAAGVGAPRKTPKLKLVAPKKPRPKKPVVRR